MINSKLIVTLLIIVVLLLILHILMNKKRENFQTSQTKYDVDLFKNTSDFVEYSKNSDKLLDMFKSLEEAEKKCSSLEDFHYQKEEKETMRDNDKAFKELQEQDKKIEELKEIVKYLTIEKKRIDKINGRCRNNKQIKLNKQYDIVRKLNNDGLVSNNSLNLDLNVSNSEALKNIFGAKTNTNTNTNDSPSPKCRTKGKDFVNVDSKDISKCYGCSAEKLKAQEPYILKDFS
jgi:hypothetical protein